MFSLTVALLKTLADLAALASALSRIQGGRIGLVQRSLPPHRMATTTTVTNIVQVYSPPKDGPHSGNLEYLQVIITSRVDTYFAGIVGRDSITNVVHAVACTKLPEIVELLKGSAVVSLAPVATAIIKNHSGCMAKPRWTSPAAAFLSTPITASCALFQNGNGSIRISDGFPISVVGGTSIQKTAVVYAASHRWLNRHQGTRRPSPCRNSDAAKQLRSARMVPA